MILDAATLARGWLSVACAASTDKERPQLYRTVCVEQHTHTHPKQPAEMVPTGIRGPVVNVDEARKRAYE